MMTRQQLEDAMDTIVELGLVTDEELALVCYINGTNETTLNDIIYVRSGYRSFESLMEEESNMD